MMIFRSTLRCSILALALAAPVASARAAVLQQTGSAGGGARVTGVRARCPTCSTRESELRDRLEHLSQRSDSLRWQINNVRLSLAERERITAELNSTVLQFKAALDELMEGDVVIAQRAPAPPVARTAPSVAIAGRGVAPSAAMVFESWKPRGYLGVTFDGQPADEIFRDGEQFVRFYQYPKIALVEPSSPAERAGILVGDTLMELNGTDVRKEISLTRLLVPEARITVRVRRDGDSREYRVVVGEAPAYYVGRAQPLPRTQAQAGTQPTRVDVWQTTPAPSGRTPVAARGGALFVVTDGVAGARLQTISERIGKALGVKQGVFVLEVRPGPAYSAGIREGDIILRAGGRDIGSVAALRELLNVSDGEEGVRLVILREQKEQTLTLRWR